jgi:hypothetical protein
MAASVAPVVVSSYNSSSLSSLMNAAGPATGSFARNARLPLSDAQGGALRGQRSCEGTLTKGRKSLAAAAPVAEGAGSAKKADSQKASADSADSQKASAESADSQAADIRPRDAPQRPRAENPCASARSARSEQTVPPAGLVVESYTPLTSGWLWARSHTGSCLLGQISGSGPQSQI